MYNILFVLSFFLSFQFAYSSDNIEITYPNDLNNFGLNDSIVFETNYEIDFLNLDTILYSGNDRILIIPKIVLDSIPDSLWNIFCVFGDIIEIDTNIFSLKLEDLDFETEYSLIIDSLVTGNSNTFRIDTVISSFFKTQDYPPYVLNANNTKSIRCGDTIKIKFWGGLNTNMFPIPSFAQLYIIDSVALNGTKDTTWVPYDSTLNPISIDSSYINFIRDVPHTYKTIQYFSSSYDNDDKELKIWMPNGFDYTKDYELKLNISQYTADVENDLILKYKTKKEGVFNINFKVLDTNKILPEDLIFINSNFNFIYDFDDTLKVYAPLKSGDSCIFYKWESNITEFDGLRTNEFEIVKSCENIEDIDLIAVYIFPCIDTVKINYDTNDVKIKVKEYKDSLDYNKFTLLKSPYDSISFLPMPKSIDKEIISIDINSASITIGPDDIIILNGDDPGLDLEDPCDNGEEENGDEIVIDINSDDKETTSLCEEVTFCITIHKSRDDFDYFTDNIEDVIEFYGIGEWDEMYQNKLVKCVTFDVSTPPNVVDFNLEGSITNSCYEITGWKSDDGQDFDGDTFEEFDETFSLDPENGTCTMDIDIYVKRKMYILDVILMSKTEKLPTEYFPKYVDMEKNEELGEFISIKEVPTLIDEEKYLNSIEYKYRYPCGSTAEWYPSISEKSTVWKYGKYLCPNEYTSLIQIDCSFLNHPYTHYNTIPMTDNKLIVYEFEREDFYLKSIEVPIAYSENQYKKYVTRGSEEVGDVLPLDLVIGMQTKKTDVLPIGASPELLELVNYDDYPMPMTNILLFPDIIQDFWESDPNIIGVDKARVEFSNAGLKNYYQLLRTNLYHTKFPSIIFHFSEDVKISSLENGNLNFKEKGTASSLFINSREDLLKNFIYNFREDINGKNIIDEQSIKIDLFYQYEVPESILHIAETYRYFACHLDDLELILTSDIQSAEDDQPLANPIFGYSFKTETPDINIVNKHITVIENKDNCVGSSKMDICGHVHSSVIQKRDNETYIPPTHGSQETFEITHIEDYESKPEDMGEFYIQLLRTQGHLTPESECLYSFHFMDEGSNNDIINSLGKIYTALASTYASDKLSAKDLKTMDGVLKTAVSELMKSKWGWFGCDTETRGKGTFYGISPYNWSPNPGKKIFLYGHPLDVNNYNRNKKWHQYNFGYTIFKINNNLVLDYWWILGDY